MTAKELHRIETRLAAPLSEWSPPFVQAMANRMAVSFHKYGLVAEAHETCDHVASLRQRLTKYEETGNTEWLVDVANFAMIESMKHPDNFRATDSDESPGRSRIDGSIDAAPNRTVTG
jgi:hypothetical protein